jgi:hypothetical protein
MNPYKLLGVARDCTREEARTAFLLKARSVHPYRGGDGRLFVELRAAHDQILANLDRKRRPAIPSEPYRVLLARVSANVRRKEPPWPMKCLRVVGIAVFVGLIALLVRENWRAWTWDREEELAQANRAAADGRQDASADERSAPTKGRSDGRRATFAPE